MKSTNKIYKINFIQSKICKIKWSAKKSHIKKRRIIVLRLPVKINGNWIQIDFGVKKLSCFPVKIEQSLLEYLQRHFYELWITEGFHLLLLLKCHIKTVHNQISAIKSIKIPCSHNFTAQTLSNDATSLRPFHFWLNPSYFCFVTFWHWIFHNKWNTAANTKAFNASEWSFTFFLLRCLSAAQGGRNIEICVKM